MSQYKTVELSYVIPDIRHATGYMAGMRPYRQGGVRMEKLRQENGKTVYHNYGHGGAGISIAYGCAKHVIQTLFFDERTPLNEEIAVLGAGIIGLSTAYLLIQLGFKVNLYAELTPFQKLKDKPDITTTVAAGYWMPLKVGNKEQTVAFATNTWNHYEDVLQLQQKTGRKLGITKLPCFVLNDEQERFHFKIPGVIQPEECIVTFGDNVERKAKTFPTFVVETPIYCKFLREEMAATGRFNIFSSIITSKTDVLSLKENHIFNCLGLGSREVFGDNNLRGIKGHIIQFKLAHYQKMKDYLLVLGTNEGGLHLQVPHHQSGHFNLGVTFEEGKNDAFVEMSGIERVLDQAKSFYQQVEANKIMPKL